MKLFLAFLFISLTAYGQGLRFPSGGPSREVSLELQGPLAPDLRVSTGGVSSPQSRRLCDAILPYLDSPTFTPEQILSIMRTRHSDIVISNYKDIEIRAWVLEQRMAGQDNRESTLSAETECLLRSSNWLPRSAQDAIMAHSAPGLLGAGEAAVQQTTPCDGITDAELDQFCRTETAQLQDANSFEDIQRELVSTFNLPNQSPRCNCLRSRLQAAYPDTAVREREMRNAALNLNTLIVQHAGRKLIDDFATSEEDLNFMSLLPEGEGFENASCINPQEFGSAMGSNCNVNQEERQRRLSTIFNSFGNISNSHTVEGLLQDFSIHLENVSIAGRSEPVTRDQFDVRRISLANTDPQVQMIQTMMSRMFSDATIRERLSTKLQGDPGLQPRNAILNILFEDFERTNALPAYLDISGLTDDLKNEINQIVSSQDSLALSNKINQHFAYSKVLHPGLNRMVSDREIYNDVISTYTDRENTKTLFERITDSNALRNRFSSNCNRYKEHLRQLVCTPADDLLKKVPAPELQRIINNNSQTSGILEMNSVLLCDNPRAQPLPALMGIFDQSYAPGINSDFREHVNPNGLQTPFKRLMIAEQEVEEVQKEVGEAVITYESKNRGWADAVGGNRFFGDRGGRISDELIAETKRGNFSSELVERVQNSQVTGPLTRIASQTQVSESNNAEDREGPGNSFEQNIGSTNSVPQTNFTNASLSGGTYSTAGSSVSANRSDSDTSQISRNQFEFDESEIENFRSNLDAEQLAELEELKKQAQIDRDRLLALTDETQQARIRALQDKLRGLENRRAETSSDDSTGSSGSSLARSFNTSPFQNVSPSTERISALNSGSVIPTNGSGSQAAMVSATSGSSASRNPASVPPPRSVSADSGAFIITSEATRNGEVASEELSLEIIKYFSQNSPGLEVLTRIKENGMLYKFKFVENGVEREREVFIQFDRLSPEARSIVERQIESRRGGVPVISSLDEEITATRRSYSYEALKLIVGQEILRERR